MEHYILSDSGRKVLAALVSLQRLEPGDCRLIHEGGEVMTATITGKGGNADSTVGNGGGGCRKEGGGGIPH